MEIESLNLAEISRTLGYNVPEISCSKVHSVQEILLFEKNSLEKRERILDSLSVAYCYTKVQAIVSVRFGSCFVGENVDLRTSVTCLSTIAPDVTLQKGGGWGGGGVDVLIERHL